MAIITTDIPFGSITITGSNKASGTSAGIGQTAIDETISKMIRIGDKNIITMFFTFNDDDEITVQLGTSIIPSGGKILGLSSSEEDGISVKRISDNQFTIDRDDTIDNSSVVSVQIIADGYDNLDVAESSGLPFEVANNKLSNGLFANSVIVDADFEGLQRNDDRSLVQFWFSSFNFSNTTGITGSLVRVKNGVNTFQGYSFPIEDITFVGGFANIESTASTLANIGLSKIRFVVSEENTNLSSGHDISKTLFNSQYIFKNEIELDLKKEIVSLPTEIMGGLDDINGFNFKDAFKGFSLTSEFFEVPKDNYVRMNYFALSVSNSTLYISFKIFDSNDLQLFELAGSSTMTVNFSDISNVEQDITIDGWRLRWKVDFSFLTSNTTLSGLTKENARFKIPAINTVRENNVFDLRYNTLGNTVNKRNFDLSRFAKDIRIIAKDKEFLLKDGSVKSFRIGFFNVSSSRYYMVFVIDDVQYTTVEVTPNSIVGVQDVVFEYPLFSITVPANWNGISDYQFNYETFANSCIVDSSVMFRGYLMSEISENPYNLTENDRYIFGSSTEKVLPYLWKSIDWAQNLKTPKTNFVSLTDHNDEPSAVTKVLSWIDSDEAIKKSITCALMQGDFITTDTITSAQFFADKVDAWFNAIPENIKSYFAILAANGNHDLGLDGLLLFANAPSKNTRRTLIHDRLYNMLPQNYKDATVRGSATDAMYYYTDVPDTNVRVIALDQFEYPMVQGTGRAIKYSGTAIYATGTSTIVAGFNVYYSEEQLNFLANALNTLPNDSTAIIMTHIPIDSDSDGEMNALGNSNIALRALLKSFKDKTNTTITVNAIDEIPSFNVSTSFSGRADSRILVIEGHIHNFYHKNIDNINYVRNMAIGNSSPYIGVEGDSISNYGADIISLDEDKDEMSILRYGSRRTINSSAINIGVDEHGFNFVSRPLKLGN